MLGHTSAIPFFLNISSMEEPEKQIGSFIANGWKPPKFSYISHGPNFNETL